MTKAEQLVPVRYVGNKPFAIDNVARSGKFWHGRGTVQKVTPAQAKRLCLHPDQWMVDDGSPLPTKEQIAAALAAVRVERSSRVGGPRIEDMDNAELVDHARHYYGLRLNPNEPKKKLLAAIEDHEANERLDDEFARNRAAAGSRSRSGGSPFGRYAPWWRSVRPGSRRTRPRLWRESPPAGSTVSSGCSIRRPWSAARS